MAAALDRAARRLITEGAPAIRPATLVFGALQDAMKTMRKLPGQEAGWIYCQRSLWPDIVEDKEDRLENYQEMIRRILSGEEDESILFGREKPSAASIDSMHAIFDIYPKLIVGTHRPRDWRILCFLADGMTAQRVAFNVRCHRDTIYSRRDAQCAAIAEGLAPFMPVAERFA